MVYEWDETKRRINLARHGLDFRDAGYVFDDPNGIEFIDERFDYDELRLARIGLLRGVIVTVVVYTYRNDVKRIISFRKANKQESKIDEKSNR
jgi:uncharacterized DUF497 family protein